MIPVVLSDDLKASLNQRNYGELASRLAHDGAKRFRKKVIMWLWIKMLKDVGNTAIAYFGRI